jgi:hypothetical protein
VQWLFEIRVGLMAGVQRLVETDIIYESHQVNGDCIVLYKTRDQDVFHDWGTPQPIAETPVRELLIREALKASAGVDFGTNDDDDAA